MMLRDLNQTPQNWMMNQDTGAMYDLGPSRDSVPALDFASGPVEYMGQKGYRLAGDPFTVQLANGQRLRLGEDMAATQALRDAEAKRAAYGLDMQAKQSDLQGKSLANQKAALELRELMTTGGAKPLTEFQGKAAGYGARAGAASDIIDMIGQGGQVQPGMIKRMAESIPMIGESLGTALNWTQSPKEQQIEQAQRDFVNAVLRQESGAAISPGEFENAKRQYFPQPGDSPDVIQQKQRNRELAVSGFATSSGKGGQPLINQARTGARQALSVQLIKDAQTAISRGANPAAVKSRLEKIGIDTSGL